jgi:predicted Rossmann fold nucleotide-binding protein DprA/Smf involved in DNA uptake
MNGSTQGPERMEHRVGRLGADYEGLHVLGDPALQGVSWTALFCSARCPGGLASKVRDLAQRWRREAVPVIGGFHTPVEREALSILLASTVPACVVLARGLPKRPPPLWRRPLDEGRLLMVSPFGVQVRRASRSTAEVRNRFVAAIAAQVMVAYAAPGSRTAALCARLAAGGEFVPKACWTLDDPRTAHLQAMGAAVMRG